MRISRLRLALLSVIVPALSACSRTGAPPATPAVVVPGTPAAVYDAILPEIRERIARETKIVRIDSGNGSIVMRFSAHLEDRTVRLVEVGLAPTPPDTTTVSAHSQRFTFLPGRARDAQDATLEGSLMRLVERRTRPSPSPDGPGGAPGRPGAE